MKMEEIHEIAQSHHINTRGASEVAPPWAAQSYSRSSPHTALVTGRSLMLGPHDPCQNYLLAAFPADECTRLFPHLELVPMPLGHLLYEPGIQMRHVYFPTTSIVSLFYVMEDGASAEIAGVGNEGVAGVPLFMGGETTTSRAVVQSPGHAYRLNGQLLKDEFYRAGPMQRLLLRYTQALLTQVAQTTVCNRYHSVDQQLCRWLLQSLDRLPSNQLNMTQELVANMLGVRRESVTEAAGKLQRADLIEYRRGHITVLDRAGLEAQACECYAVVKNEFDRPLPSPSGRGWMGENGHDASEFHVPGCRKVA